MARLAFIIEFKWKSSFNTLIPDWTKIKALFFPIRLRLYVSVTWMAGIKLDTEKRILPTACYFIFNLGRLACCRYCKAKPTYFFTWINKVITWLQYFPWHRFQSKLFFWCKGFLVLYVIVKRFYGVFVARLAFIINRIQIKIFVIPYSTL